MVPKLIQLFTTEGLCAQPYSINFGPSNVLSEKNLFAQRQRRTSQPSSLGSNLVAPKAYLMNFGRNTSGKDFQQSKLHLIEPLNMYLGLFKD